MAFYLTRELTPKSYSQIGQFYQRDHTTVLAGYRNMCALVERDEGMRWMSLSLASEVLNACA
jgi:chromosomal replication initiation ATPase DnaA